MNADQYLLGILQRETVAISGPTAPAPSVLTSLRNPIVQWARQWLVAIQPSGSYAKGTAIRGGTDVDIFISLRPETPGTLREIYYNLHTFMGQLGYSPMSQNVSIGIRVGAHNVDLVPARRQDNFGTDHSVYRRRADTWTKTNVLKHISYVRSANRLRETRLIKLWRNQKKLDFPSFYLELAVIEALRGTTSTSLSTNVLKVLEYLRDKFANARLIDPANTNNVISDDLTVMDRAAIKNTAAKALVGTWGDVVA